MPLSCIFITVQCSYLPIHDLKNCKINLCVSVCACVCWGRRQFLGIGFLSIHHLGIELRCQSEWQPSLPAEPSLLPLPPVTFGVLSPGSCPPFTSSLPVLWCPTHDCDLPMTDFSCWFQARESYPVLCFYHGSSLGAPTCSVATYFSLCLFQCPQPLSLDSGSVCVGGMFLFVYLRTQGVLDEQGSL